MSAIYGIYGASGYGKEVYPLLKNQLENEARIVFIDDTSDLEELYGCQVLAYEEFLNFNNKSCFIVVAIADSKIREKLTNKCLNDGIKLFNVEASNIVRLENVDIADGYILNPFVTLTSDIKIGKSFQANLYSYVAHDCIIGDYVTFAPSVKCNGNIVIEDHVYIGTGVIIKQGKVNKPLKIGKGAIIGAGAVVTKNIPAGMTVFGNPAIELTKENLKRRM
jgi:sugar O-acyltransferase (sialic acid O-acetyltransferase NeuD family)